MNSLFARLGSGMLLAGAVFAAPALAADNASSMNRLNSIGDQTGSNPVSTINSTSSSSPGTLRNEGSSTGNPNNIAGAGGVGSTEGSLRGAGNSNAPAHQLTQEFTPQAQYRLARREAYAAYEEMVRRCGQTTGTDRSACMQEARGYLRDDLAYAKQHLQSGNTVGARGVGSAAGGSASGQAGARTAQ